MENALAMEVTSNDTDDQAGHGESHERNREEGDGQDEEGVVDLTTCSAETKGRSFVWTESLCWMRTNIPWH